MARKKRTPEERERWEAQKAEWSRQQREFQATFERWLARIDAGEERERRRRRRLRLLTLGLLGR